ncbi:MAG TPA: polymer-forming cytoskeletal protein [Burkholderiales bacterium]|jgi:cytoskeletal protein CcmA (bactofilin family)|nr:polymer-forming cytoskeletal protein [Burkholderiales bacterium]
MFNTKDTLFGKKDEIGQNSNRAPTTPQRPQPATSSQTSNTPAPAYVAESPPASITSAPAQSGSKLIVGPDIKLKGVEITDCDTLVVEGRVEASMDSRVIQIAEHGVYSGTVGIDVAEIHGRFEGELTARKQLVIHATGRVSGTIRYGKITVEEGGEISGTISTLSATAPLQSGKGSHADMMTSHDQYGNAAKVGVKPATPTH